MEKTQQEIKRGRWRGGGGTGASRAGERVLTFVNVDRNLLAEKCCAITTKAGQAEKKKGSKKF